MTATQPRPKTQIVSTSWTDQILEHIDENGIPAPWQDFGQALSRHGALSTDIVAAVATYRNEPTETNREQVIRLYQRLFENLEGAIQIVTETMRDFDTKSTWASLDRTLACMDMAKMRTALEPALGLHPFPVVLESLQFNWAYMREHGIRAFYTMTVDYLGRIKTSVTEARDHFVLEASGETRQHNWLIVDDLRNIEVPTHCDVCRMSIVPVLVANKLNLFVD